MIENAKIGDKVYIKGKITEVLEIEGSHDVVCTVSLENGAKTRIYTTDLYRYFPFGKDAESDIPCQDCSDVYKQAENNFISFVCKKLDDLKALFKRKNQQYSVGADPLANFRAGALLRAGNDSYAEMYEEAKDYQRKHVVHIERNGIDADKGDESLDDIIVYSAIMAYMRYCYEQEQSNG